MFSLGILRDCFLMLVSTALALWLAWRCKLRSELLWPWLCGVPVVLFISTSLPTSGNATSGLVRALIAIVVFLLFLTLYLTYRISTLTSRVHVLAQQLAITHLNLDVHQADRRSGRQASQERAWPGH